MSKRTKLDELRKKVDKIDQALKYPTLASEEGYAKFEAISCGKEDRVYALYDKVNRLLDYLGLEDVTTPAHRTIKKKPSKSK